MKPVRADSLLVFDLEVTCWEGAPPQGKSPEIIEIGMVEVDAHELAITREASFLVRPSHLDLSDFCQKLTGITPAQLKAHGRPLEEVLNTLARKWGARNKLWTAWGRDDLQLVAETASRGIDLPIGAFVDFELMFRVLIDGNLRIGLSDALQHFEISFDGRPHSGLDDARNTAQLAIEAIRWFRDAKSGSVS